MKEAKKAAKRTTATKEKFEGFTAEERAVMKEHAEELKTVARRGGRATKAEGESDVRKKIAEMQDSDRALGERIHAIVMASAPDLTPRLWYGMPAYAKDGKLVCYFQAAQKFKSRYATFGFEANAKLDDGNMWPTSFAVTKLTAADEARIAALVKQAVR
jgi:uncharacterized protein YdhG (YjbR/CyaY superfamily)